MIDIARYRHPHKKEHKHSLFAFGLKSKVLSQRKIKKSITIGTFRDKIEIIIKSHKVQNEDIRILSHILTHYKNNVLLKMGKGRSLHKVGTLKDENHNMVLFVHTISPNQQNHYIIKVKHSLGGFLHSPTAHSRHHAKIMYRY